MSKTTRLVVLTIVDSVLICASIFMSYLLRFDFKLVSPYIDFFPYVVTLHVVFIISSFYIFKIYKRMWQYASVGDLISIFKGAILGSAFFFVMHQLIVTYFFVEIVIPRSIYILSSIISFLTVAGSRFLWRILRDNYTRIEPYHRKALIIGAGETGVMVVRELKHSKAEVYPVAFIDDNLQKQNYEVMGIPVVGARQDIPKAVSDYDISDIIIAIPSVSRIVISEILSICKNTGCQIKIIPRMNDFINGKISLNMIRDVSVEDLLGREPINIDLNEISQYLQAQTVLVTGAGGSIGSELCRQIARFKPKQLLLLGHGENSIYNIEMELKRDFPEINFEPLIADVQDNQRINSIFKEYEPQVVFHAAAHKHVPLMERNPLEAVKNNILGTYNVAVCSHNNNIRRFVMISTDKAVNPTNIMGATKRVAEMIIQAFNQISETRFSAVRFGNVLGSRGSVVPLFKKQIEEGGPVTVTHPDMIRYFMTIPEASQLVIQAGAMANDGEVFILDMGQPVKIDELARDLIRLSGLEPDRDIKVVYTGIRPGEKLFEEILTSEEGTAGTKNDRIFIGRSSVLSYDEMQEMVRSFERLTTLSDSVQFESLVVAEISKWVKNYYKPDYSKSESVNELGNALKASLQIVAAIENR